MYDKILKIISLILFPILIYSIINHFDKYQDKTFTKPKKMTEEQLVKAYENWIEAYSVYIQDIERKNRLIERDTIKQSPQEQQK